ncbi:hypothetical protein H5410_014738 [Solanum commersonii]|uniref:Uncharacterized protein n=1 Tax=Solanum commersonii TaxID=4109 RepID=A0A9J5ZSA1_SOLCO|nr:hypothetical protein H5410_014738 [Solanum commersonii]
MARSPTRRHLPRPASINRGRSDPQMTSSNDIHHQPKPGRIIRGVCASAKRHRLWLAPRHQPRAHRLGDINQRQRINQGIDTSDMKIR